MKFLKFFLLKIAISSPIDSVTSWKSTIVFRTREEIETFLIGICCIAVHKIFDFQLVTLPIEYKDADFKFDMSQSNENIEWNSDWEYIWKQLTNQTEAQAPSEDDQVWYDVTVDDRK